eukprot:5375438-Alexandrium_andersonii.AAC.1
MEASRGAIGQAIHELLEGPRRRDLPSRVLKGRDDEGCSLPLVVCRGECGAERLGVWLPWLRACNFRAQ